jgi:hypothetical protein
LAVEVISPVKKLALELVEGDDANVGEVRSLVFVPKICRVVHSLDAGRFSTRSSVRYHKIVDAEPTQDVPTGYAEWRPLTSYYEGRPAICGILKVLQMRLETDEPHGIGDLPRNGRWSEFTPVTMFESLPATARAAFIASWWHTAELSDSAGKSATC